MSKVSALGHKVESIFISTTLGNSITNVKDALNQLDPIYDPFKKVSH